MEMTTTEMIAGQQDDVKGAILDLATLFTEGAIDWKTVAVTLETITPIANRLVQTAAIASDTMTLAA